MVVMHALKVHTHYDPTGTRLEVHHPGDRYELHDGQGMTAEQLANSFEALGVSRRAEPGQVADLTPAELAPVGELPKSLRSKKAKP
jgi:hypothetical protein